MKEISTAVVARRAVEIAVNGLRMKLSVGSIESQPTGIPLLRIRTPNMQCFQAESRAAGWHRDKLRRLSPDTEATRRVQNLVEERRKLVDEKTEQINRLTG